MIKQTTDHDIIIRVDQKVSDLQKIVSEIRDGTVADIAALQKDKADKDVVESIQKKLNDNIETRVHSLEITKADFREKVSGLRTYMIFLSGVGILLIGIIIFILTNGQYHI